MSRIARPYRGRAYFDRFRQRGVAAALLAIACLFATTPLASAETRSLKLYFIHTKERAEITYKKNGKYLPSGLKQINQLLRDWRRNEPTKMDPRLLDLVWQVYREAGASDYIHVVSAYRSPATNSMLRKRSRGVAQKSQHMLGKAMDFYIPGVKLAKLRAAGLRAQGGGVGYYPSSGSPFVHLDVGNVRHWPRMSRSELAAVFPDGKTLHVPTDGKPLPGYEQALASYKKRGGTAIAMASESTTKRSGGFLSAFFGGGADDEEDSAAPSRDAPPQARPRPDREIAVARAEPQQPVKAQIVDAPFPPAQAAAPEEQQPQSAEQLVAALPLRDVPRPIFAPRPSVDVGAVPAAIPAIAAVEAVAQASEQVAVADNVPVPMWRPERPAAVAAAQASAPVNAIAAAREAGKGGLAIEDLLAREAAADPDKSIPAPVFRPEPPVVLASLGGAPVEESATAAPEAAKPEGKSGRVAMLGTKPPAPRDAVRWREGGSDPVAALSSGVVTTQKSAKPVAADGKPDRKPVVVPAQGDVVRWALNGGTAEELSPKPDGRAFAFNSLRAAPATVYTAGFQTGGAAPEANRFTGKAVTFLSVAKFHTN